MAIEPISAGITAGGALLGGLFGAQAEKEKQKRQALQQAIQQEGEAQKGIGEGQTKAFQSMMDAYKSALIR